MRKKIIVLTGAGMSQESGISTFRDADGLWEGHDVHEVASPDGWRNNPSLVLDFYNQRRRQLKVVQPNAGHLALHRLEVAYDVQIITQNVDNLHEKAGSSNILHLHGELTKVRSTGNPKTVLEWHEDLNTGDQCREGFQLRPHIVWFGEDVPNYDAARRMCQQGDIFLIIGTSMQVYPAAGLIHFAPKQSQIYYVDPKPHISWELSLRPALEILEGKAGEMLPSLVDKLLNL